MADGVVLGIKVGLGYGPKGSTAPVLQLIEDKFDRPNSDTLGSADTGQAWVSTPTTGSMGILDNAIHPTIARMRPANVVLISDPNLTADHVVEITISKYDVPTMSGNRQVIFRGTDTDNLFRFGADVGYGGHYRIVRKTAGTDVVQATDNNATMGVPKDGDRLKVVCSGVSMKCYVNGVLFFNLTYNVGAWGPITDDLNYCGISMGDATTDVLMDDFKAYNTFRNTDVLTFDGVDDYVDIGKPIIPNNTDFTIITRFRTANTVLNLIEIWSEDVNASLKKSCLKYESGAFIFSFYQNDGNSGAGVLITSAPVQLTPNTVYTVAVRRTGNVITIYLDGRVILADTTIALFSRTDNAPHQIFGRRGKYGSGALISHTLYTRSLSADEIIAYTPEHGAKYANVLAHYDSRFKESAEILTDTVGSNHGTIYGGAKWVPVVERPVKFSDNFNRVDSSTSLGTPWTSLNGDWGIVDNTAYRAGIGTTSWMVAAAVIDSGTSNGVVTVTFTKVSIESRLIFRAVNINNFCQVKAMSDHYVVRKIIDGVSTALGSYNVVPKDGDVISAGLIDNVIILMVNGVWGVSINAPELSSATRHGIGGYTNPAIGTERYDDFKVEGWY